MDLLLNGKIVLITGASRGLGFATAKLLAQEGAQVIINSRDPQKLQAAANRIKDETGHEITWIAGDVTLPEIPAFLIQQIQDKFGGLDILIANAGGPPAAAFMDIDDETWQKAAELSFFSQVRLIRAAIPLLRESTTPSVLTVTSYSIKQPIPNLVLSNSIRAATVGLTKTLALELGSTGIRFNSILPGWTETERIDQLLSSRSSANHTTRQEEYQKQVKDIALGRMAQPEEFARVAVFMVSPAASYLTGVMLPVDGGAYKGTL